MTIPPPSPSSSSCLYMKKNKGVRKGSTKIMSRGGGGSNTNNNSRGEDSAKIAAAVEDLQIQFESTTTTDAASSSSSELEQHHNYPKVILQADKLGRSAHAQILRILPKSKPLVSSTPEWKRLQRHAAESIQSVHLRDMLQDPERCQSMYAEHDGYTTIIRVSRLHWKLWTCFTIWPRNKN